MEKDKDGKCPHGFPKTVTTSTIIEYKEVKKKKSNDTIVLIYVSPKRDYNSRNVNSYNIFDLLLTRVNIDWKLVIC